jgi:hypothetical protein
MPLVSHYLRRIQFAPILLSEIIIRAARRSVNRRREAAHQRYPAIRENAALDNPVDSRRRVRIP